MGWDWTGRIARKLSDLGAVVNWLTMDGLCLEYARWPFSGRNEDDLRFGQYLSIKYDGIPDDVFMIERAVDVYLVMHKHLTYVQR